MNKPRAIALSLTLLIAIAAIVVMTLTHLSIDLSAREWPPVHRNEVALVEDDNFFEVVEMPRQLPDAYDEASPARNDVPADNQSTPEPTTGPDLRDVGAAASAPAPVTSKAPSPVKQQTAPQPQKQGPSKEQLEAEAEARRRATAATAAAFDRSQGRNNVSAQGNNPGNSGTPAGGAGSYHGHGHGQVNGGWIVPAYKAIPSTMTGKVRVSARIDSNGNVVEASLLDGTAPAGTDPALRQKVLNEVKARKFTRKDSNAPASARAIITYTFE